MLVAALAMLGACSDKEEINNNLPQKPQKQVAAPNITAQVDANNTTRAVIEGNTEYKNGEKFRWVEGDQVLVRFTPTTGEATTILYKVDKVNVESPNLCIFIPVDADATIAVGTYTAQGFSSPDAWTALLQEGGEYTLPTQTQVGNQSSTHLHGTQLMQSDAAEVTITEDEDDFSLTFHQLTAMMRFAINNDDGELSGATVKSIALISDAELFNTSLTYTAEGALVGANPTNLLTMDVTDGAFDAEGNFHGFMAISPQALAGTSPEKLHAVITVTQGDTDYYLTARVNGANNVNLPTGFETGKSYSFSLKTSKLAKAKTVFTSSAAMEIYANPEAIDDYCPLGKLVVEGPINALDITAIGTRMRDAGLEIKELDLSGTEGASEIASNTFYGCSALKEIVIPEGVATLNNLAFNGCTSLSTVTLPYSLTAINNQAFQGCKALKTITLPHNLNTIGEQAFKGCTSLETVTLNLLLTTIGDYAFQNCDALETITIQSNVTSIGDYAFYGCDKLKTVTLQYFGGGRECTLGKYAFADTPLESISLEREIKTISEGCFDYCTQLTSITLPGTLEEIHLGAFNGCSGLGAITIPASVKVVGGNAFTGSSSPIIFEGKLPAKKSSDATPVAEDGFLVMNDWISDASRNIFLPNIIRTDVADTYKAASSKFENVCFDFNGTGTDSKTDDSKYNNGTGYRFLTTTAAGQITAELIAANLCSDSTLIVKGPINTDDVITIASQAKHKGIVKAVDLKDATGLTTIPESAFSGCTILTSIVLPTTVTSLGESAFASTTMLKSIVIPNGVKTIPYGCFSNSGLSSITLPEGLELIGERAFYRCAQLKTITLPASVNVVGHYAFYRDNQAANIVFEGTMIAADGGSATITTAQDGCLVINNQMNFNSENKKSTLFLPNITDAAIAATYNIGSRIAAIYFNYSGTGDKFDPANYTLYDPADYPSGGDDFKEGGGFDL